MKVTVLGVGAWGTALARLVHFSGNQINIWGHDPVHLNDVRKRGRNERYLPGIELPAEWNYVPDLERAVAGAECVIIAVPSKAFREVTRVLRNFCGIAVSVTKGIEYDTGLTMCGILRETAPQAVAVALSGPTFAAEVARDIPSAIVAASTDPDSSGAKLVQQIFHRPTFRVYTSSDIAGVELGGALKNVIAVGAGVCDGLAFGDNSKAALVTRAIVEIRRLGICCGAHPETFAGLSGLGDLMVTCFSRLSRNRALGERLGRGETLTQIVSSTVTVAEGWPTSRSAYQLARKYRATTPIIDEVYAMLWEGKDIAQAVRDLTTRDSKAED